MVVGQIEAKMLLDRSNFTQGIKLTQHETSLLIPNLQAAAKAEGEVAGGAVKAGSAFEGLAATAGSLIVTLGSVAVVGREVWSAFKEFGDQETSINRIVHAAERLKLETDGLREAAVKAGTAAMLRGQREEAGFTGFQKLLQVTKDRAEAEYLFGIALDFSTEQEKDLVETSNALARAHDGQFKMLMSLLSGVATGVKEFKTFGEVMTAVTFASKGANTVISEQSQAVFTLAATWDNFRDIIGKLASPKLIEDLDVITRMLKEVSEGDYLGALNTKYRTYGQIMAARAKPSWRFDWSSLTGGSAADQAFARQLAAWKAEWDRIFGKDEDGAGGKSPVAAKVKDDLAERIKMLQEYVDLQNELAKAAEQTDKDLTERWEKDHRVQMQLLDGTGSKFKSVFVDLVSEGKFSIEDFGKSFVRMLAEIAADEAWNKIRDMMMQLWGLGSWRMGGGKAMYGGQGVDYTPGTGSGMNVTGSRGGYLPPMLPPTIPTSQPVTVNHITVQGDVTRFAEFSEKVLNAGFNRRAALR